MLKPQDIVILLKIISRSLSEDSEREVWTQSKLALHLCMSGSEVHAGIRRLCLSKLLAPRINTDPNKFKFAPVKENCVECLVSAVKYFIPAQLETYTRGIATAYAAPIFEGIILRGDDPIPVWPYVEGDQRGLALEPLYRTIPQSIIQYPDQLFYELLVLVDAIRFGRARERSIAVKLLKEKIDNEYPKYKNDDKSSHAREGRKETRRS